LDRKIEAKLLIGRPDGETWEDVTEYVRRVEVDLGNVDDVGTGLGSDSPVRQCSFVLQQTPNMRFAPRDQDAPINAWDGSYAPLLWPNREVMVQLDTGEDMVQPEPIDETYSTTANFEADAEFFDTKAVDGIVRLDGATSGTYIKTIDLSPVIWAMGSTLTWDAVTEKHWYPDMDLERDSATDIGDDDLDVGDEDDGAEAFINLLFDTTSESTTTSVSVWTRVGGGDWSSIESGESIPLLSDGAEVFNNDLEVRFLFEGEEAGAGPEIVSPDLLSFQVEVEAAEATKWRTIFHGLMGDRIDTRAHQVHCDCRDFAKVLQDTFIEEQQEYGSESGVPAEDVIQEILDENLGGKAPTLYTPFSPGFMISPEYYVEYESVWDAIQTVAAQIGWFLGYRYVAGEYRLVFMAPPRTKTDPDFTLDWEDDFYKEDLDISDADIRNAVTITYRNEEGDRVTLKPSEHSELIDQESIDQFGRKAMLVEEADSSLIRTQEEALAFGAAAINDLSTLTGQSRMDLPINPYLDLFSTIQVRHPMISSTNDFFAIDSLRHTMDFTAGRFRTESIASGKVVGGKHKWLQMQTRPGSVGKPLDERKLLPERVTYEKFRVKYAVVSSAYALPSEVTVTTEQVAQSKHDHNVIKIHEGMSPDIGSILFFIHHNDLNVLAGNAVYAFGAHPISTPQFRWQVPNEQPTTTIYVGEPLLAYTYRSGVVQTRADRTVLEFTVVEADGPLPDIYLHFRRHSID